MSDYCLSDILLDKSVMKFVTTDVPLDNRFFNHLSTFFSCFRIKRKTHKSKKDFDIVNQATLATLRYHNRNGVEVFTDSLYDLLHELTETTNCERASSLQAFVYDFLNKNCKIRKLFRRQCGKEGWYLLNHVTTVESYVDHILFLIHGYKKVSFTKDSKNNLNEPIPYENLFSEPPVIKTYLTGHKKYFNADLNSKHFASFFKKHRDDFYGKNSCLEGKSCYPDVSVISNELLSGLVGVLGINDCKDYVEKYAPGLEFMLTDTDFSIATSVPKDCFKRRPIGFYPRVLMHVQRIFGEFLLKCCKTGMDVHDDSKTWSRMDMFFNTYDLKDATDRISLDFVSYIIDDPPLKNLLRKITPRVMITEDGYYRLTDDQRCGEMGNGYTWSLLALLFDYVSQQFENVHGFTPRYFMFGDDLIIHEDDSETFLRFLNDTGAVINPKKSWSGTLKESCGRIYTNYAKRECHKGDKTEQYKQANDMRIFFPKYFKGISDVATFCSSFMGTYISKNLLRKTEIALLTSYDVNRHWIVDPSLWLLDSQEIKLANIETKRRYLSPGARSKLTEKWFYNDQYSCFVEARWPEGAIFPIYAVYRIDRYDVYTLQDVKLKGLTISIKQHKDVPVTNIDYAVRNITKIYDIARNYRAGHILSELATTGSLENLGDAMKMFVNEKRFQVRMDYSLLSSATSVLNRCFIYDDATHLYYVQAHFSK